LAPSKAAVLDATSDADMGRRAFHCTLAIYWGLDIATYERATKNGFPECRLSEDEIKVYRATNIKKSRDLPFVVKSEACLRDAMNKQFHADHWCRTC
jgi:hypothetical protein